MKKIILLFTLIITLAAIIAIAPLILAPIVQKQLINTSAQLQNTLAKNGIDFKVIDYQKKYLKSYLKAQLAITIDKQQFMVNLNSEIKHAPLILNFDNLINLTTTAIIETENLIAQNINENIFTQQATINWRGAYQQQIVIAAQNINYQNKNIDFGGAIINLQNNILKLNSEKLQIKENAQLKLLVSPMEFIFTQLNNDKSIIDIAAMNLQWQNANNENLQLTLQQLQQLLTLQSPMSNDNLIITWKQLDFFKKSQKILALQNGKFYYDSNNGAIAIDIDGILQKNPFDINKEDNIENINFNLKLIPVSAATIQQIHNYLFEQNWLFNSKQALQNNTAIIESLRSDMQTLEQYLNLQFNLQRQQNILLKIDANIYENIDENNLFNFNRNNLLPQYFKNSQLTLQIDELYLKNNKFLMPLQLLSYTYPQHEKEHNIFIFKITDDEFLLNGKQLQL